MSAFLAAIWIWPELAEQMIFMALLYVGSIFAFLGGIQWGLAIKVDAEQDPNEPFALRLIIGVIPSLITFVALVIPSIYGGLLLIASLWLLLAFEWQRQGATALPAWYLPLRMNLTILLSGSLAAMFWLAPLS